MTPPISPASAAPTARGVMAPNSGDRGVWLAIAVMWGVLMLRLTSAWTASVELAHGWAVPALCALIVWSRRERAPACVAPVGTVRRATVVAWVAGVVLLAVALPVLEANRLWPSVQWIAAAGAALGSFGLLARACGVAWARYFVFPIFFATTALAWPAFVQTRLVDALASANAQIAAEAASLAGHPAVARGNVIEVGAGLVGVDEACAGLRSLQAVWMLAWFLGEIGRFSAARRLALVAASLALAFVGNAARATFLTLRVAAEGAGGNERWHDFAGNVAMGATFVAVFLVVWVIGRGRAPAVACEPRIGGGAGAAAVRWAVWSTCGVIAFAEIGTRVWFGWHERAAAGGQWELQTVDDWRPLALAAPVREVLRFTSADCLQWNDRTGTRAALAYVFRWEDAGSLGTAGMGHEPTVCMPAIGARLVARPAPLRMILAGRAVEFSRYRFETAGRAQHVFYGVWDVFRGRAVNAPELDIFWRERLQRVREGRMRADATHLVFVWETESGASDGEAEMWLGKTAPRLLRAR